MNNLFRKKKHSLLLCTLLLSAVVSRGQLVQNPGFESGTVPNAPGQISRATGWSDACTDPNVFTSGGAGVDLCDRNSTNTQVKVPSNNWGSINERTGQNRYAHLWQRGDTFNGVTTWSGERLKGTLTETLGTGCYSLCFWAARANTGTITADAPHQIIEVYLVNGSACTGKLVFTTTAIPNNGSGQSQWNSYCADFIINSTEAGQYTHILFQLKRPSTGGINQSVYIDDVDLQRTPTTTIPQISGNNNFCVGGSVTVTGSTLNGSAIVHSWQMVESDAFGNPVSGAPVYSPSGSFGPPGSYTFPASAFSGGCNKYYRIKLTILDGCGNILESTKVILYSCLPTVNAGLNYLLCWGECATLNATASAPVSWTYVQSGIVVSAGSGNPVTVCPQQTTTYTATAVNKAGCRASDNTNVVVIPNNPAFTTNFNPVSTSYYNTTATPVDLAAASQSGFGYAWILEGLDASDNVIFTFNNPTCWQTFTVSNPGNVFKGFNHVSNSYSGTYTSVSPCLSTTPAGQFKYNQTYRITRLTWSDFCAAKSYSVKSIQLKSLNGDTPTITWVEDTEAPDYSHLVDRFRNNLTETAETWSVYPNPGTGVFQVNSETADGILSVSDLLGKTVYRGNLQTNGSPYTVDLSNLPKGVYVFSLRTDAKTHVQKVILQ